MENNKTLLNHLILSKKNIKRKIIEMKRGIIDSDHDFRETFKPIIEPLNAIVDNKKSIEPININEYINEDSDSNVLVSDFENFLKIPFESRKYDKSFGLHYDKNEDTLKIANYPVTFINGNLHVFGKYFPWTIGLWSLLCEKVPINTNFEDIESYYEILKTTQVHLKSDGKPKTNKNFKWVNVVRPLYERMKKELKNSPPVVNSPNINLNFKKFDEYLLKRKSRKNSENSTPGSISSPTPFTPIETEIDPNLIQFTTPSTKKGYGLYKTVLPKTQIVYYDDPNELVTRLNLLVSSQNAGNTGVNNEIISILEELRERNLIL